MSEPFRRKVKEELPLLHRAVVAVEEPLKRMLFGCAMCGQCVLSNTAYVCPMGCPKGLRNGPCGGTLDGRCEVHPDMNCVWLNIHRRRKLPQEAPHWEELHGSRYGTRPRARRGSPGEAPQQERDQVPPLPPFQAPVDRDLVGTSSYLNFLTGRDRETRKPVPYGDFPSAKEEGMPAAGGLLERRLRSGEFALTAEIHSPKSQGALGRVEEEARALAPFVDALNATSNAGGKASVSSLDAARRILAAGAEPVLQICGRDVDAGEFARELHSGWAAGARNVLCLTGDWSGPRGPRSGRGDPWPTYFPMDSAQMIYEARAWRERGEAPFAAAAQKDLENTDPPRFFVGGVINPFSTPAEAVLARLAQKAACGAEFIQTQAVLDVDRFMNWLERYREWGLDRRVYLLPSVPVILSLRSFEVLAGLPGVYAPEGVRERLARGAGSDGRCERAGLDLAGEICSRLAGAPGVDGVHLMIFGGTWTGVADWVASLRERTKALVHAGGSRA